jgi:biopolymer transport protein ExbB
MLSEYGRVFETRIHISEVQRHKAAIDAAKLAAASPDLSGTEKFERQIELVKASAGRAEGLLGGNTFHGQALAPSGRIETGKFALIGPVAIFASDKSEAAGLVELQLGSPEPTVVSLEPAQNAAIRTLATSGSGELPLDASGGSALKIAETRDGFVEHIVKGGVVMIPIILLAVAAAIVGLIKWIQLARLRVASPKDLQIVIDHLNTGHADRAKLHAKSISGPSGELLAIAVEHAKEKKELIEEVLYEKMLHFKPRLERTLPFLALTAAAAPLLGLLGTVTGMISTFNMISVFGTGDPRTLSGGISEALITTEWGLLVAIPALFLHAVLARRVKGILAGLEQLSVGFINGVPDHEETLSFE